MINLSIGKYNDWMRIHTKDKSPLPAIHLDSQYDITGVDQLLLVYDIKYATNPHTLIVYFMTSSGSGSKRKTVHHMETAFYVPASGR